MADTSSSSGDNLVPQWQPGPAIDPEAASEDEFRRALLAATPTPLVTWSLIAANTAVFLAMTLRGVSVFSPSPDDLIRWGADYGPLTTHGQWWRLLTNAFVHSGWFHLLVNMVVLVTIGSYTERLYGHVRYTVLYLLGALGGSFASLVMHPLVVSAGASGAVCALGGGLLAFLIVCRGVVPPGIKAALTRNALAFAVLNLLPGGSQAHIDIAAHAGGLLAGLAIGGALVFRLPAVAFATGMRRSVVVGTAVVALSVLGARRLPVVDDWSHELALFITSDREVSKRFNDLTEQMQSENVSPAEFAGQLEHELLPAIAAGRRTMRALRLPTRERVIAETIDKYLELKAGGWRLIGDGVRSGDMNVVGQGIAKQKQAEAVIARVIPHDAPTRMLRPRADADATPASAQAFASALQRIEALENRIGRTSRATVARFRRHEIQAAEFAAIIEREMLAPWNRERGQLESLQAPLPLQPLARRIADYMALRSEAWRLNAAGLRAGDNSIFEQGNAKHQAAERLMKVLEQNGMLAASAKPVR